MGAFAVAPVPVAGGWRLQVEPPCRFACLPCPSYSYRQEFHRAIRGFDPRQGLFSMRLTAPGAHRAACRSPACFSQGESAMKRRDWSCRAVAALAFRPACRSGRRRQDAVHLGNHEEVQRRSEGLCAMIGKGLQAKDPNWDEIQKEAKELVDSPASCPRTRHRRATRRPSRNWPRATWTSPRIGRRRQEGPEGRRSRQKKLTGTAWMSQGSIKGK